MFRVFSVMFRIKSCSVMVQFLFGKLLIPVESLLPSLLSISLSDEVERFTYLLVGGSLVDAYVADVV